MPLMWDLREAAEQQPDSSEAQFALGLEISYQRPNGHVDSMPYLRRTLELDPEHSEARCQLGWSLVKQGANPEAEMCFRHVLERNPEHTSARIGLHRALVQEGRHHEAAQECTQRGADTSQATQALEESPVDPAWLQQHAATAWEFWRNHLGSPLWVCAPMVLQSERPFRTLVRRHGVHLCYTPMIRAGALLADCEAHGVEAGRAMHLDSDGSERPLVVQASDVM